MSYQEQIYAALKHAICDVMSGLDASLITPQESLRNLGTNSLDRAMILMQTMEDLQLRIPMIRFAEARNISEIVAVFEDTVPGA